MSEKADKAASEPLDTAALQYFVFFSKLCRDSSLH